MLHFYIKLDLNPSTFYDVLKEPEGSEHNGNGSLHN